ncbi:MAG: menaquinone biosynthesis protein [Saprospiraceae bacterium]|nr:menaquinone biosynthesis protein [Saprospiraceae bacterium]
MSKINVSAVSYLNTKPFLYGIFQHDVQNDIHLSLDIPSVCAAKLVSGEVDLGLVPVAVIPQLTTPHIISDYCIGAVGAVKTVCIFSEVPIEEVTALYLDFHSRTSVALAKVLLEKHWHLNPILLDSTEGYIDKIEGTTAGVVIGDRTMGLAEKFKYVYDLGQTWEDYTEGLPFVFAAWVSNKKLPDSFIKKFNEALKTGLQQIPQLIYILPTQYFQFDLKEYFTKNISYTFDKAKKTALERFLSEIESEVVIDYC